MKFEAHLLWSTPLYLTTDTNLDNDKLAKYIYNNQKDDPDGRVLSNDQNGWQSNLLDPNSEVLKPLSDTIYKLCLGLNLGIEKIKIPQMWANINPTHGFNVPHQHGTYQISGTYYVQTPENCGNIVHRDPRPGAMSNGFFNDRFDHGECRKTYVKEGLLAMWPSFVDHYVEPNRNTKERISISFDVNTI